MSDRHRGLRIGKSDAPFTILWIHGYTGSPDAFAPSAERFAEALGAHVMIPLLPGHGTREENLPAHSFDDFLDAAQHFHQEAHSRGKPLAIMGYSFGAYISLLLAAQKNPEAIVLALPPYDLRFPFFVPGFARLLTVSPFWGKFLTQEDLTLRQGTFYYPHLPGKSLFMITEGKSRAEKILRDVRCPILAANNADDPLALPQSGKSLLKKTGDPRANVAHVFPRGRHTFFMGPYRDHDERVVIAFLKKHLHK